MISLLLTYKYLILFPLAVIEGPIITVLAGIFVKAGVFNLYSVYALVVFGDIFGDTLAYSIGRYGSPILIRKFSKFFQITEEKREKAEAYFNLHKHKTLIFSKILHGVGIAGLMTAGNLKVSYRRFFTICLLVSLVQSALFLALGILFGHAYVQINNYVNFFSVGTVVLGVVVLLILFIKFRIRQI